MHVTSRRGSVIVRVRASAEMPLSQVFLAMHWGEEFLSGISSTGQRLAGVNALTTSVFCPDSKQPEFKHAAVKVLQAELPWSLLAVAWLTPDHLLHAQAALRPLMANFAFASCVPFSNAAVLDRQDQARSGVLFRAAHHDAGAATLLAQIEDILELNAPDAMRYVDAKRGQRRTVRLHQGEPHVTLSAFLLAGDTRAQSWMLPLLQDALPAHTYGRALLVPGATPPMPVAQSGQQVCSCFNVTDQAISTHLAVCPPDPKVRFDSLQATLKCGTNCGSCVPQLQRIVKASLQSAGGVPGAPAVTA